MERYVSLRVPATSANCGPGFDSLGLAVNLYNEVTYELTDSGFQLEVEGEGKDFLKPHGRNLAFQSFLHLWNKATDFRRTGLKVRMINRIPMARGLGSSSAAIVGGLAAANILSGANFSREVLLQLATEIEGHPDNVAPAIYGGFTVSFTDGESGAHTLPVLPAKPLQFVAVVPEMRLATSVARQAIPAVVPHHDAVFNASRTGLLVGSLLSGNYTFLGEAMEDKLHQPYRAHLIPHLRDVFEAAKQAGAYNAIISGAGSTIMAYVAAEKNAVAVAGAMCEVLRSYDQCCSYHILQLDTDGVKVI